jgi:hypothetical protein
VGGNKEIQYLSAEFAAALTGPLHNHEAELGFVAPLLGLRRNRLACHSS